MKREISTGNNVSAGKRGEEACASTCSINTGLRSEESCIYTGYELESELEIMGKSAT